MTEWRRTRDANQAQQGSGQGNKKKVKIGSSEVIAETETAEADPADASSATSSKMRSILRRIKHGEGALWCKRFIYLLIHLRGEM